MSTKNPSMTRGFSIANQMANMPQEEKIDYETYKVNEMIAEHVENKELFA